MTEPADLLHHDRPGRSARLESALSDAWSTMDTDYGLLPDLPLDAVLARADRGELVRACPRLLELLVGNQLKVPDAADVAVRLGDHPWPKTHRRIIEQALDSWWLETLMLEPGEHTEPFGPEVVLGVLVGYDAPMVRWLEPWLAELDGPGAAHLGEVIVAGPDRLTAEAWDGKDDQAVQLFGWARTETVINGLALVGGTHLDAGLLSDVLDRLI